MSATPITWTPEREAELREYSGEPYEDLWAELDATREQMITQVAAAQAEVRLLREALELSRSLWFTEDPEEDDMWAQLDAIIDSPFSPVDVLRELLGRAFDAAHQIENTGDWTYDREQAIDRSLDPRP